MRVQRRRKLALTAAACVALLAATAAAAADQVATASGTCGVAINASGQAKVVEIGRAHV